MRSNMRKAQRGVTLVEMLVGLMIGLLVIGAAITTMLLSRSTAAVVSDISQLQQQGSFALRMLGMQARPAGSLELTPTPGVTTAPGMTPVAFDSAFTGFNGTGVAVYGTEGASGKPDTVSFSYQATGTLARDCLGDIPSGGAGARIDSTFSLDGDTNSLRCKGVSGQNQPLAANVADLQVWYRVKSSPDTIQRMTATGVAAADLWSAVSSVEICLDLQGVEKGNPSAPNYIDCNGATVQGKGVLHQVFRNVFDLRTQGA
jgi:type IV pilus assembly protein PilW